MAAFTSRWGGVSPGFEGGLNLSFHVGDSAGAVLANRTLVAGALGIALDDLVLAEQVHGNRVRLVGAEHAGAGAYAGGTALPAVDALVTSTPGLVLAGCFADCVPVYIIDSEHTAVGLAHAGWRGTAGRIAQATFQAMHGQFGSRGNGCVALVGPAIGRCCYHVGPDVALAMQDHEYWQEVASPGPGGGWSLDLAAANCRQLEAVGITRVHVAGMCTSCDPGFFSHRRDRGQTGRMMALLGIRAGAGKARGGGE